MGNKQDTQKHIKPITHKERKMCLGKMKHKCKLGAEVQLEDLKKYGKHPETLGIYECPFCKNWHCGNSKQNI